MEDITPVGAVGHFMARRPRVQCERPRTEAIGEER